MKPDFHKRPGSAQSGYALILMVLALIGVGGIVLTGFTRGAIEEAEHERYLHNQRVLKEAKQALLQYAYNYPQMGPGQDDGPGRLLCPDSDNDGMEDYVPQCAGTNVGRFPWAEPDLNFYDARDASQEPLWYAVSKNFGRGPFSRIYYDQYGTITIEDRSGAVLYDGTSTVAGGGIAAVIIAPGAAIARNGTMQDRAADENDPVNYLDLFGAIDNADFINEDPNGFVTGPIRDVVTGDLLVNDQMIVITAAEVIAMAEMATLQAYRKAILDYLNETGGVYPWLYNYDGIEYVVGTENVSVAIDKLSRYWPAFTNFSDEDDFLGLDNSGSDDGIFGRIPSMFAPYFTDVDSRSIDSRVSVVVSGEMVGDIAYTRSDSATGTYTFVNTIWNGTPAAGGYADIGISGESLAPVTGLRFEADTAGDGVVKLIGSIAAGETYPLSNPIWFWSRNDLGTTEWAQCGGIHIEDCHVDSFYIPDPHGVGQQAIQILKVEVELVFDPGADAVEFELDTNNLPDPRSPLIVAADATNHAWIGETFAAADVLSNTVLRIRYEWDDNYTDGNWDVDESGTLDFDSMVGPSMQVGLRYYPVLPNWMANGWHKSIRMAYALEYKPPGTGPCTVDTTCLHLNDSPGKPRDAASLLVISGPHEWQDVDLNGRLRNDVDTAFDDGNHDDNPRFYRHLDDDKLLVIEKI